MVAGDLSHRLGRRVSVSVSRWPRRAHWAVEGPLHPKRLSERAPRRAHRRRHSSPVFGALRIIDRGAILAAARHALDLHRWLTAPDFDQEGDVQRAEQVLAAAASGATPLLAAATGLTRWLDGDGHGRWRRPAADPGGPGAALDPSPPAAGAGATDRRPRAAPRHALGTRRLGAGVTDVRWLTRRTTPGSCCSQWSAPGSPPATPWPVAAATPAPPPRWTSSPLRRCSGHLARRWPRHGGQERHPVAR